MKNLFNDFEQFRSERKELENSFNITINIGIQHILRFKVPEIWQILEDYRIQFDSSLCYINKECFQYGVCYQHNTFNIKTRKKLNLKEKFLIVMKGSFMIYQIDIEAKAMENKINNLINKVKKYNGLFAFLWHNSSFNSYYWENINIYEKVLK